MFGLASAAGLKAAGSIFGGLSSAHAMREVKRNLQTQQQQNQDWFDRRYNEDATQRADAQRLLTMTEESIRNRNLQAAGAQAVMGGTEESVAAAKAANNEALADTTSRIAAQADARKDKIEQTYQQRNDELNQQLNNLTLQQAHNTQQAIGGLADAANGFAQLDLIKAKGKAGYSDV